MATVKAFSFGLDDPDGCQTTIVAIESFWDDKTYIFGGMTNRKKNNSMTTCEAESHPYFVVVEDNQLKQDVYLDMDDPKMVNFIGSSKNLDNMATKTKNFLVMVTDSSLSLIGYIFNINDTLPKKVFRF